MGYSWEETQFTSRGFETQIMTTLKARMKTQMSIRLKPRSVISVPKDADVSLDRENEECDCVIERREKAEAEISSSQTLPRCYLIQ